jgi:hypothetical protein
MLKESKEDIIKTCQKWVETFIIGLNLCPFAKAFYVKNQVRFSIIDEKKSDGFLLAFGKEIEILEAENTQEIETTLLIIPAFGNVQHFMMYFNLCQEILNINNVADEFMLIPFHPFMRHEGQKEDAPQQFTSIAPYPIIHILKKKSVAKLGAAYKKGNVQINNDKMLRELGIKKLDALWKTMM